MSRIMRRVLSLTKVKAEKERELANMEQRFARRGVPV